MRIRHIQTRLPHQVDDFFDKQATVLEVAVVRVSMMIQPVARIPHIVAIMLRMHTLDYHVIRDIVSFKNPFETL